MKKSILILATAALCFAGNPQSPSAQASVTIAGKSITIKYSAPSLRGRKMFGSDGQISKDPTYPAWRTGADDATALHTDADLMIGTLNVPKGDYTIYTLVNVTPWQLIINKQTKQWGTEYDKNQDLGRVAMNTARVPAPIETLRIRLTPAGGDMAQLEVEWENISATVPVAVK